jgi:nicotinate-nucleotide adenylyltransferase
MRTLCFGGTFNPIHHGHLICARAAAEAAGFDRVLLIPSANPPLRLVQKDLIPAQDRLTMCQLAVEKMPFFATSGIELERADPSYTLESARELRRRDGNEVCWLIGADSVPQLPRWHEPLALLQEVRFVVMERPGAPLNWDLVEEPYRALQKSLVAAPLIDISGTDIRRRILEGKSIDFLVPPGVQEYIERRGLYRA